jgi:hypothetical protein
MKPTHEILSPKKDDLQKIEATETDLKTAFEWLIRRKEGSSRQYGPTQA